MDTQHSTTRYVRKFTPYSASGWTLFFVAIISFLFVHVILGFCLLIAAIVMVCISRQISICGDCGNEVANTSRRCPCCQSLFTRVAKAPTSKAPLYAALGSLLVAAVIGFAMWWMIYKANQ